MPRPDLVITGERVVTADGVIPAAVVVKDGTIRAIEPLPGPDAAERVDAGDAAVLPGFVDTHVHVNEPGRTEWEGFETATLAAAAGGVTTIVDMPLNSSPVTTSVAALDEKARAAARSAHVDYGFWGGVVPGNAKALVPLARAGVLGFKCFLVDSGIPEFAPVSERDLEETLPALAGERTVLLAHAELPGPIAAAPGPAAGGDGARRYAAYLASRPPEAEHEAIALLVRLCERHRAAIHVVHLASAGALEAFAQAARAGLPLTVETCPHYLTFAAEEIPDGATAFKCAPPIREAAHRERLWRGLAEGTIALVASDHSPCPPSLKDVEQGDFFSAWGGIASLQLAPAAVWTEARRRGHGLADLTRWLSEGPAHLAGLADRKGALRAGRDADIVLWDPDAHVVVTQDFLHHRHRLTPYEGMQLFGVARRTFVRGRLVYDGGAFPSPPAGRWLKRRARG